MEIHKAENQTYAGKITTYLVNTDRIQGPIRVSIFNMSKEYAKETENKSPIICMSVDVFTKNGWMSVVSQNDFSDEEVRDMIDNHHVIETVVQFLEKFFNCHV